MQKLLQDLARECINIDKLLQDLARYVWILQNFCKSYVFFCKIFARDVDKATSEKNCFILYFYSDTLGHYKTYFRKFLIPDAFKHVRLQNAFNKCKFHQILPLTVDCACLHIHMNIPEILNIKKYIVVSISFTYILYSTFTSAVSVLTKSRSSTKYPKIFWQNIKILYYHLSIVTRSPRSISICQIYLAHLFLFAKSVWSLFLSANFWNLFPISKKRWRKCRLQRNFMESCVILFDMENESHSDCWLAWNRLNRHARHIVTTSYIWKLTLTVVLLYRLAIFHAEN